MDKSKDISFSDAVNTYYKLKGDYEDNITKIKNTIKKIPNLSWKEKRTKLEKKHPKCINCKRAVGTLFSTQMDEKNQRILMALCGDRTNKCPLNIRINMGKVGLVPDDIQEITNELDNYNRQIIMDKNDLIFGYVSDIVAIELFKQLTNKITKLTSEYREFIDYYLDIVDNEEQHKSLETKQKLFNNNVLSFKDILHKYKNTSNTHLVQDALSLYLENIVPLANEIRNQKYSYVSVDYDEDKGIYRMVTIPTEIEELEYNIDSTNAETVESFVIGMVKSARKNKTIRGTKSGEQGQGKKTRRKRNLVIVDQLIEEREKEDGEENEEAKEKDQRTIVKIGDSEQSKDGVLEHEYNSATYIDSDDEEMREKENDVEHTRLNRIQESIKDDKYQVELVDNTDSTKMMNRGVEDSSSDDTYTPPPPPPYPDLTDEDESDKIPSNDSDSDSSNYKPPPPPLGQNDSDTSE